MGDISVAQIHNKITLKYRLRNNRNRFLHICNTVDVVGKSTEIEKATESIFTVACRIKKPEPFRTIPFSLLNDSGTYNL